MTPDQPPSNFDHAVLELAVSELGEVLRELQAYEARPRPVPVKRAAIREKARTGRLKPMRQLAPTGPVGDSEAPPINTGTGTLSFDLLEDAAAAALADLLPAPRPDEDPS
ncbi:MAG: hypothetical protein ACK46X_19510 [Candidatus Sericytochromatia bacterium]